MANKERYKVSNSLKKYASCKLIKILILPVDATKTWFTWYYLKYKDQYSVVVAADK